MKHNGIEYNVVWFTNKKYTQINNKPDCGKYKKDTLLINEDTLAYYHCGEIRNKPDKTLIDEDLKNEKEKRFANNV